MFSFILISVVLRAGFSLDLNALLFYYISPLFPSFSGSSFRDFHLVVSMNSFCVLCLYLVLELSYSIGGAFAAFVFVIMPQVKRQFKEPVRSAIEMRCR